MTDKVIAIIQTGGAIPSALEKYGDFDDWFIRGMAIDKSLTKTYRVFEELIFPDLPTIAGIIITGSASMVTEKQDWSEKTISWLKSLLTKNIPILGVCYGHQLLAKLLGGTVCWNPRGREIGQVVMQLTKEANEDDLFGCLIQKNQKGIDFIATHQQSVTQLPENVTMLGSTILDPFHCFRYKNNIWGLQFHPEFTPEIINEYIHLRSDDMIAEGLDPVVIISGITKSNHGKCILEKFKEICLT